MVCLYFRGQFVDLLQVHLVLESFVRVKIVMCEQTMAFVRMDGVGRDDVEVTGAQHHVVAWQMELRLALGHVVDADEGRTDVLPVPVGIVLCASHVQQHQIHRLYGYLYQMLNS